MFSSNNKKKNSVRISIFVTLIFILTTVFLPDRIQAEDFDYFLHLPILFRVAEPSPTPTPTATPQPLIPTPTATSTPNPVTSGNVQVIDIFFDGAGSTEPDEYVALQNQDTRQIQLHNWTLRDNAEHIFKFPEFIMEPGQTCRVYTDQDQPAWCSFSYGSSSAIWNNSGDCAYLRDAGGSPIDTYCYP